MLKTVLAAGAVAGLAIAAQAQDAPATDATAPETTEAQTPAAPPLGAGLSEVDLATISTDTLIGTEIRTYDQKTVAAVQDVLLSATGQVENVVARFGGFLGFGETTVLLEMDELAVVRDSDENVFVLTSLMPEAIKARPKYQLETY